MVDACVIRLLSNYKEYKNDKSRKVFLNKKNFVKIEKKIFSKTNFENIIKKKSK